MNLNSCVSKAICSTTRGMVMGAAGRYFKMISILNRSRSFCHHIRKFTVDAKPSNYKVVSNQAMADDAEKLNGKKIFYFTAVWCPPCRMIAPIFEKMSQVSTYFIFYSFFRYNYIFRTARELNSSKLTLMSLVIWLRSTVFVASQHLYSFLEILF